MADSCVQKVAPKCPAKRLHDLKSRVLISHQSIQHCSCSPERNTPKVITSSTHKVIHDTAPDDVVSSMLQAFSTAPPDKAHLFFRLSHPLNVRRTPSVLRPIPGFEVPVEKPWCPMKDILVLCIVVAGRVRT